ncbi:FYN-binding protein [Austrofundulus limnaeus]|uniref:FYN-binding protein n=1 Tax=Austrofundulus limnaeus TaxID=52670 RepID=A0A2I4BNG1_AUSLI|nr:PREDICTED: FYN-binding protein-like [Austrofundulus limnaeus]
MDEDGPTDFKALRAKFQEEGLVTQWKTSRPAVAEKPKHFAPPVGPGSSAVGGTNSAGESNSPVVPRVFSRDALRSSGGKRSISLPPQRTPPPSQPADGHCAARQSLRDRNMPLVLPVPPSKDQRLDLPTDREHSPDQELGKDLSPQNTFKKNAALFPFKSVKATKASAGTREGATCADFTNRPSSAPGDLPSVEKPGNKTWLQREQAASDPSLSSPEILVSPPSSDVDPDNSNLSTAEKAKSLFSLRQMFISAKIKTFPSPDKTFLLPPENPNGLGTNVPPPVCRPHLACISARPFSKVTPSPWKPAADFQLLRDKAVRTAGFNRSSPVKKRLPDLSRLGPVPTKPSRPPIVDISSYPSLTVKGASPAQLQTPDEERPEHTLASSPLLAAPEFPDFENSEVEAVLGEAVDITALELEALDLVYTNLTTPSQCKEADLEAPEPAVSEVCGLPVVPDLNLGSPYLIPLDPACFPGPINLSEFPEQQSYSQVLDAFTTSETDLGAAESQSLPEETELRSHTSNDDTQTYFRDQDYYNQTSDVYEDVESVNKSASGQGSTKQKNKLKNPYDDPQPAREEQNVKRTRHTWGSLTREHSASYGISKEQSSPNAAVYKEQRKKEKQRLEKERKEQKEREKKDNEMKKKFKVTGNEEPMYHAKVMVASKVRKNDLPVMSGDTVSIIRTTNCPKGKWLARDANHKYGYISVMNVELNMKEMLELGKKAQAAGRGGNVEADTISNGSRSSTHPALTSSFTDDSEEWAHEEDTLSPSTESHPTQQTASEPETSCVHVDVQQTLSDANLDDLHTLISHEALQKLAFILQSTKNETFDVSDEGATPTNVETSSFLCAVDEPPYLEQDVDFTEMELLPPPPLYADNFDLYMN